MTRATEKPRGRPKGAKNRDRAAIIKKAEELGKTPLEIMLESSVALYKAALSETDTSSKHALLREAADIAAKAAPYVHRRMPQAVENRDVTGETWEQFCERVENEREAGRHAQGAV